MKVRLAQILTLSASLVALVAATGASAASGPANLHPFLLRVDEARADSFSRTPSFAWNPVAGAQRYEFQLSTSASFRDSGIIYSDTSLTTPVAAPALTLPWITGTPHALYARVRAVLADGSTLWSRSYGFDMEPPKVPTPLPSYPGLLRWTPADGAVGYQVWFVDIPKIVSTSTNVVDQREFYTFHQAASWLGQVRWRIRAVRHEFNKRANGLPAATYGPWSPVYTSVNPPFAVGPLKPLATVSDIVSTGAAGGAAHRLTPAFVFGGNQTLAATSAELYRVHVFTDRRCVNRVYSSAIVGGPAYAPRYSGPLALPRSAAAVAFARGGYLADGKEGDSFAADGEKLSSNESLESVKPTVGLPAGTSAAPATPAAPSAPSAPGAPAAPVEPSSSALIELIKITGDLGPPVGLWDTDWSNGGGYYWTVVPVEAKIPGAVQTTLTGAGGAVGGTTIPVAGTNGFVVGDAIMIGSSGISETATVTTVAPGVLGISPSLKLSHAPSETVIRISGAIEYREAELAQDACAAGRVLRFGKESEPTLTAGGELFASGLSPAGKLTSAQEKPAFYGSPLVAWTAALGAEVYAVQWSKTRVPFKPETDPATTALGMMTMNTSAVLPLEPGTWHYRVRGYSYSLPEGAQAMSWSQPQQIVVTRPTFRVVTGEEPSEKATKTRTLSARSAGFSIQVPSSFRLNARSTAAATSAFRPVGVRGAALRLAAREPAGAALFVQTSPDTSVSSQAAWARKARAGVSRAGAARCASASLPAGAGLRCTLTVKAGSGKQATVVYLFPHRNATYTLTFAGKPNRSVADAARFAAAARSFRFTR